MTWWVKWFESWLGELTFTSYEFSFCICNESRTGEKRWNVFYQTDQCFSGNQSASFHLGVAPGASLQETVKSTRFITVLNSDGWSCMCQTPCYSLKPLLTNPPSLTRSPRCSCHTHCRCRQWGWPSLARSSSWVAVNLLSVLKCNVKPWMFQKLFLFKTSTGSVFIHAWDKLPVDV